MATPAFTLVGVDGCKKQWLAVLATSNLATYKLERFKSLSQLFDAYPTLQVAAVDTPIGLPDEHVNRRRCDQEAKALLGPMRSSVFYAPQRFLLNALTQPVASALSRSAVGMGISAQAFNIIPYIRDSDASVQTRGQGVIKEVHPEVSFWCMNGRHPLRYRKKDWEGKQERKALLVREFDETLIQRCDWARYGTGASLDDLYDALAALWSARRILDGNSYKLPEKPEKDAEGLVMEINY